MRNFEKELGERIRIANKSFRILQDPHLKIVYDEAYQLLFEIWSQSNSIDERENIYKTKEALDLIINVLQSTVVDGQKPEEVIQ